MFSQSAQQSVSSLRYQVVEARSVAFWSDDLSVASALSQSLESENIRLQVLATSSLRADDDSQVLGRYSAHLLHMQSSVAGQLHRLRELRRQVPLSPLLVLCEGMRDLDQVLVLEMGADDVVSADAAPHLLAARLRASWRRLAGEVRDGETTNELHFSGLTLHLSSRSVRHGDAQVLLTDGEFDVLWLLASRAGTPVSRQELLQRIRGLDFEPFDRSIDSRICRIREKMRAVGIADQRIRTVRGRGYVFAESTAFSRTPAQRIPSDTRCT